MTIQNNFTVQKDVIEDFMHVLFNSGLKAHEVYYVVRKLNEIFDATERTLMRRLDSMSDKEMLELFDTLFTRDSEDKVIINVDVQSI